MNTFTLIHVFISLAGIAAGLVMAGGWLAGRDFRSWTGGFLLTTAATSVTGFFFPFKGLTPAIILGVLSLVVMTPAIVSYYVKRNAGGWRTVTTACGITALYFNFFVLVVQLFQNVPAMRALAPTQAAPAFGLSQAVVLAFFLALGISAVSRMRNA